LHLFRLKTKLKFINILKMYHQARRNHFAPQIDDKQPTMAMGNADLMLAPRFKTKSATVSPYRGPEEFPANRKAKLVTEQGYAPSNPSGAGVMGGKTGTTSYRKKSNDLIRKHLS
jgi:hypothetical protein